MLHVIKEVNSGTATILSVTAASLSAAAQWSQPISVPPQTDFIHVKISCTAMDGNAANSSVLVAIRYFDDADINSLAGATVTEANSATLALTCCCSDIQTPGTAATNTAWTMIPATAATFTYTITRENYWWLTTANGPASGGLLVPYPGGWASVRLSNAGAAWDAGNIVIDRIQFLAGR